MKDKNIDIKKNIDAYIKGQLNEEEISALWVEFAKNPSLLEELELEIGVKKLIEEGALSSKDATKPKTLALPTWTWHAAAAAVLFLVAFIQIFQVTTRTELSQFVIGTISPDQAEAVNSVRSEDLKTSTPDSLLNLGFNAFLSGNLSQAISMYNQVIKNFDQEPYGSKAFINKGIIFYNDGEYESAISAFDEALARIQENKMLEEKALWFKGNAQVNIEELVKARETIFKAYALNGVFRKPAFLLLQKLNYDLGYVDYENFEAQQDGN